MLKILEKKPNFHALIQRVLIRSRLRYSKLKFVTTSVLNQRYRRSNQIFLLFFIVYLTAAVATVFRPLAKDYPFFSGHWFYHVPSHFSDYSILVSQLDGRPIEPPKYIEKIYHRLVGAWPFAVYGSIQDWGHAREEHLPNEDQLKEAALITIFRNRSFKAQLVKREMDGIEFVDTGRVEKSNVIEEIESK